MRTSTRPTHILLRWSYSLHIPVTSQVYSHAAFPLDNTSGIIFFLSKIFRSLRISTFSQVFSAHENACYVCPFVSVCSCTWVQVFVGLCLCVHGSVCKFMSVSICLWVCLSVCACLCLVPLCCIWLFSFFNGIARWGHKWDNLHWFGMKISRFPLENLSITWYFPAGRVTDVLIFFSWFFRKHQSLIWLGIHSSAKHPLLAVLQNALPLQESDTQYNVPGGTVSMWNLTEVTVMSTMIVSGGGFCFWKVYFILLHVLVFGLHVSGQKSVLKVQTVVSCHMGYWYLTQVLCKLRSDEPSLQHVLIPFSSVKMDNESQAKKPWAVFISGEGASG